MTAFTPDVIGVVNDETVDGSQRVDERGTTNNTHIIKADINKESTERRQ